MNPALFDDRATGKILMRFAENIKIAGEEFQKIIVAFQPLNDVLNSLAFHLQSKGQRRRAAQRMIREAKWHNYIRKTQGENV